MLAVCSLQLPEQEICTGRFIKGLVAPHKASFSAPWIQWGNVSARQTTYRETRAKL
jgi:hypothetical protein